MNESQQHVEPNVPAGCVPENGPDPQLPAIQVPGAPGEHLRRAEGPSMTPEREAEVAEYAESMSPKWRGPYVKAARGEVSPRKAIEAHCRDCGESTADCQIRDCPLWPIHMRVEGQPLPPERQDDIECHAKYIPASVKGIYLKAARGQASPRRAIAGECLDCMCWDRKEVGQCHLMMCPLWPYRPYQVKVGK